MLTAFQGERRAGRAGLGKKEPDPGRQTDTNIIRSSASIERTRDNPPVLLNPAPTSSRNGPTLPRQSVSNRSERGILGCLGIRRPFRTRWLLRVTSGLAVVMMAGCIGGRGSRADLQIWAVPDLEMVNQDTTPEPENEVFSEVAGAIQLDAAINETVSFQLVIRSERSAASVLGITVAELRQGEAAIPQDQVTLYREQRVEVNEYPTWYLKRTRHGHRPRAFPDLLIPLTAPRGALPIDIERGESEAIWVDVHVPVGTEPGVYHGRVRVTTEAGAGRELALVVNVWPFALPQTRHLGVVAGVQARAVLHQHMEVEGRPYAPTRLHFDDPLYERATAVLDATMRLLHDHRCSPVLTDVHPVRRMTPDGNVELDWSDYDRLVAGLLEGSAFEDRAAAAAWPMPIDDREPSPAAYDGWGSATYERMVVQYLRQCVEHFQDRRWFDRHYVWIPLPGPGRGERYRQFERLGQLARQASPEIQLVCPLAPQPMGPFGLRHDPFVDVSDYAGVWCPPPAEADAAELAHQKKAGRPAWLRPGQPPYTGSLSLLAPGVHARSLPWQAYRFGYEGLFLPTVIDWEDDQTVRSAEMERSLIWPGKAYGVGGPIPSIRLKRLMRGLQDYEYLWLLGNNRRPGIARLIAGVLVRYGGTGCYGEHLLDPREQGWVSQPWAWMLARRLMARELMAAMETAGDEGDAGEREDVEQFEQELEWTRLTEALQRVYVQVEGVRVHFDVQDENQPVVAEATVSVFNATRVPANGKLAASALPEDWVPDGGPAEIEALAPGRRTRRVVRLRAKAIHASPEGVLDLPVALWVGGDEAEPVTATGRVCVLTSQRLTGPIVVDGDLSDWPLAANVASDFALIGARDDGGGVQSDNKASQLTTVFVCDDREYLYIGFNCEDDQEDDQGVSRTNYVRYDGLWPVGEDLVEVVLDPKGRAVGPGDLLHVLVKANGAVITERGAKCLELVAPHEAWDGDVAAAVDDRPDTGRWTVEIRIPLTSLGERGQVWGVNFARFEARRGEYSSWSAVPSNLFNPVTLGNLLVPR